MKNTQFSLDPKDLLVLLELAYGQKLERWTYKSLAEALGLSPSQVHASVVRLIASGLLSERGLKGKVNREALLNFIIHGARYAFPPVFGKVARGIKTGSSSGLFVSDLMPKGNEPSWVWPSPKGDARGISLTPLHPSVTKVILDPDLHRALVHFDALRAGDAREREVAVDFFQRSLKAFARR